MRWTITVIAIAMLAGCAPQRDAPETTVSWLAPQTRAAKPLDCPMPMLAAMPNADYQQLAIIEVSDDYHADDAEVIGLARRKACETGADALVILENARQKLGNGVPVNPGAKVNSDSPDAQDQRTPEIGDPGHQGHFLNGVAIAYPDAAGSHNASPAP